MMLLRRPADCERGWIVRCRPRRRLRRPVGLRALGIAIGCAAHSWSQAAAATLLLLCGVCAVCRRGFDPGETAQSGVCVPSESVRTRSECACSCRSLSTGLHSTAPSRSHSPALLSASRSEQAEPRVQCRGATHTVDETHSTQEGCTHSEPHTQQALNTRTHTHAACESVAPIP